ncbi:hypothetical protein XA68_10098 [Ophiocordyceps unilateralis]|uniref:Uncharacterized protein n=1 Tax=Ophiocordyceps unilateralis TaxID=268505 RepID=A0A2A9PRN5_OPHUN|nr:hypothetical protein XA68_10098 [Ophiocordyceps unilateralis]
MRTPAAILPRRHKTVPWRIARVPFSSSSRITSLAITLSHLSRTSLSHEPESSEFPLLRLDVASSSFSFMYYFSPLPTIEHNASFSSCDISSSLLNCIQ